MNVVRQTASSVHFLALLSRSDSISRTLQKEGATESWHDVERPVTVVTMGLESRDWYREEYRKSRKPRTSRWFLLGLAVGALVLVAVSPPVSSRFGNPPVCAKRRGVSSRSAYGG